MKPSTRNQPSDALADFGLNENPVRHVVATFRFMDGLLNKAQQIMT